MADGRQRAEWVRAASLTASLLGAWVGRAVDPFDLVPDRYREAPEPPRGRTPEEERAESEMAWRLLGRGLGEV